MLVSSINFLLRDGIFDNLDDICSHFGQDPETIKALLASGGYEYSLEQKRVI
ncbi:MAG: DUF4250 domain-containing protein [Bacteroidales bacterium]|nr:DUF4250 domain-containing protein [Bacteroidales bacterium]